MKRTIFFVLVCVSAVLASCSNKEDDPKKKDDPKEVNLSLEVPEETIMDNAAVIKMTADGVFYGGMIVEAARSSEIQIDLDNDIALIQWIESVGKKVDAVPYTATVEKLVSDAKYITAAFVYNEKGIASKCTHTSWFAVGKIEGVSDSNDAGNLGDNEW